MFSVNCVDVRAAFRRRVGGVFFLELKSGKDLSGGGKNADVDVVAHRPPSGAAEQIDREHALVASEALDEKTQHIVRDRFPRNAFLKAINIR